MVDFALNMLVIVFLLTGSLKISIFNFSITGSQGPGYVFGKYVYTLIFCILIRLPLLLYFPWGLAVYYLLEGLFLYVGISYCNFYHYVLHILQGLKLLRESLDLARHKSVPRSSNQLLVLIDLPYLIAVLALYDSSSLSVLSAGLPASIILCCALILLFEVGRALRGQSLVHLLKDYPRSELQIVANYGTLFNMLIDFVLYHRRDRILSQFDYGKIRTIQPKESGRTGAPKKPNIIVIQAESVDANAVNLFYEGRPVMPHLHALQDKSIYYPFMMNYHKAGGTSDAEFSIINSVEPLGNYPSIKLAHGQSNNSFVKLLAADSYQTAVFHGNEGSYYQRHQAFAEMGFEKFYDLEAMGLDHVGWGAPDHQVLEFVLAESKKQQTPFLYYIITMSNHCRFTNALNYHHNPYFDSLKNRDARNFYNSLSYVDHTVHSFVESLRAEEKKNGKLETYILIFGDHTPGLKKSIYPEASLQTENRHVEFVPFYILTPDSIVYREKMKAASFLDIGPTILELSGVHGTYTTYGESLLPPNNLTEKIPYRGHWFDRAQLYQAMEKELSSTRLRIR